MGKLMKKFVDSRDEAFIVIFFNSSIFFIKKFNFNFIFCFLLQEKCKAAMFEKHGEDISTHPPHDFKLWLKARATDRPDTNQVYGMP